MSAYWNAEGQRGGIPRGIAREGLPILSYGFRPFFLAAGVFAFLAMALWLGALLLGWSIGGTLYDPVTWHGREMLFGYAVAALAGFLLTTVPNWTGRLPVSGTPLLLLLLLWLGGRLAMAAPNVLGETGSAVIDCAFLLVLWALSAREIISGKNWKNLKVLIALGLLALTNIAFHLATAVGGDTQLPLRVAIAIFVVLIGVVGGRIVPSFTRNWLVKQKCPRLPTPLDRFDSAAMVVLVVALAAWTIAPLSQVTAVLTGAAAVAHGIRLARWRGFEALREPMLVVLHLGYGFIVLGMAGIALSALGLMDGVSALHLLTVGAIGNMTLAVMTRATLGHTGRPIRASAATLAIFTAVFVAAAIRPLAEFLPEHYFVVLGICGAAWMVAFVIFTLEYGAMVLAPRQGTNPRTSRDHLQSGGSERSR